MKKVAKKTRQRPVAVGVVWYTPEEWARVKAAAVDPQSFEHSFPQWEAMAKAGFKTVRRAAGAPVKVLVSADELLAWCLAHGKQNNAEARAAFVSEKMRGSSGEDA